MKSLVLVGANNPELPALVRCLDKTWLLEGFIDDDESTWHHQRFGQTVLGSIQWFARSAEVSHPSDARVKDAPPIKALPKNIWLHNSIGSVSARRATNKILQSVAEDRFATLVHPSVSTDGAFLGIGVAAFQGAVISPEATIGDHTILSFHTVVAHESTIGEYCTITPGAIINGRCTVGNDVYIGSGAVVLPDLRIGEGATLGAGAVVTRDVPAGKTVFGNPARILL